jgi:hypothetical protein
MACTRSVTQYDQDARKAVYHAMTQWPAPPAASFPASKPFFDLASTSLQRSCSNYTPWNK